MLKIISGLIISLNLFFPVLKYWLKRRGIALKKVVFNKNYSDCVILGNGPSLKSDMEQIIHLVGENDFIAVNHFAESDWFVSVKPSIYLLLDPYFWSDDAHDSLKHKREALFHHLKLVSWSMQIFVPDYADLEFLKENIQASTIELVCFKVAQVEIENTLFASRLFKGGMFAPRATNVLIYAVYLALIAKYKKIMIYGADFSMHNDLRVDQTNNNVYIIYKYFHGEQPKILCLKSPQLIHPYTMYEYMKITASSYLAHDTLSLLAKKLGVKVINKSSYSLIDSYARN